MRTESQLWEEVQKINWGIPDDDLDKVAKSMGVGVSKIDEIIEGARCRQRAEGCK
ncbi:MAG: hypothetical protein AAB887_02500 [Patescibacteria group bacterium]